MEEFENRAAHIIVMEDDLIAILNRHLDFLLSLNEKEKELKSLEGDFQNRVRPSEKLRVKAVSWYTLSPPLLPGTSKHN